MVMWGNLLYEYSQLLAAVNGDWRSFLEQAVSNFRLAGCPEEDITAALRTHTQAPHLELGAAESLEVLVGNHSPLSQPTISPLFPLALQWNWTDTTRIIPFPHLVPANLAKHL
jgi:hypothetical protein